jgi:hypothetical protein
LQYTLIVNSVVCGIQQHCNHHKMKIFNVHSRMIYRYTNIFCSFSPFLHISFFLSLFFFHMNCRVIFQQSLSQVWRIGIMYHESFVHCTRLIIFKHSFLCSLLFPMANTPAPTVVKERQLEEFSN